MSELKDPTQQPRVLPLIGYILLVLISIVGVAILVEFDTEGNLAKKPENYVEGNITLVNGVPFVKNEKGTYKLERTNSIEVKEGNLIFAYALPGTQTALVESNIPHIPRGVHDILIVSALLLGSMLLVIGDPSVAFFDLFAHV